MEEVAWRPPSHTLSCPWTCWDSLCSNLKEHVTACHLNMSLQLNQNMGYAIYCSFCRYVNTPSRNEWIWRNMDDVSLLWKQISSSSSPSSSPPPPFLFWFWSKQCTPVWPNSLCSPGWPEAFDYPISVSQMLGL